MIRFLRDLRLVPIAVVASVCLLALKAADLVLDGGPFSANNAATIGDTEASVIHSTGDPPTASDSKASWAQQMFSFPGSGASAPRPAVARSPADKPLAALDRINSDITGTVTTAATGAVGKGDAVAKADPEAPAGSTGKAAADAKAPPDAKAGAAAKAAPEAKPGADGKPGKPAASVNGTIIPIENNGLPVGAERALLERLQERRQELDTRARELDIRESLIKAAEKRMGAQLTELKEVQGRISSESQKKDEAQASRLKGLVTMYENMKPRDAAKIFDRLDIGVLLEVSSQINPRQMAEILAQMAPDSAERLTVELANQAQDPKSGGPADLPKIEGRPTTP